MVSADGQPQVQRCVQIEANVDDLDPRIWPHVIDRLLQAGAHDAWITPIVMKKGRPAFTLGVLCAEDQAAAMRHIVFTETTTIGLREISVLKHALARHFDTVDVQGHDVGIKRATLHGQEVNRSVEWDDVARVADALGMAAGDVLAAALAASQQTGRQASPGGTDDAG